MITFGETALCRHCGGTGRIAMTKEEKNARARELRRAKQQKRDPDPIQNNCGVCAGRGYLPAKDADKGTR